MTHSQLIEALISELELIQPEFADEIVRVVSAHCTLCSKEPVAWLAKPGSETFGDEHCTALYRALENE